ncbi:MAG: MFS transporter [Tannerellaceae bacterium]|jgi:polyol permease family|nr:MFS transporter [Tannerellaceae bacterium]
MNNNVTFFEKIGLSRNLVWGYTGILIFMMGDGVEQGWLSPYLVDKGLSIEMSAMLFTVYGIAIALASWLSGVMADTYGVRKTMAIGLLLYCVGVAGFAGLGMPSVNYSMMLITYGFKGLGYPLFAYTFMVWIAYKTPQKQLSSAQGWFWFVFTGGLNVLGTYYASYAIYKIGPVPLLWTAILFALIGAIFALLLNPYDQKIKPSNGQSKIKELAKGFTILKKEPKVLLGGIVRTINTTPQFAFPVFMPMYLMELGFTLNEWLYIWGAIFTANIAFNLIYGIVGDRIGWQKTIIWFGATSAAASVVLFYYSPQFSGNLYVVMFCGILWGISLAGYVPLSALVPSLVKEDKGSAVSILNLGAGLPVFVGPALVGLLFSTIGSAGIIWVFAGLYIISAILTKFITPPAESEPTYI